jgi:hypothetical protein
MHDGTGDAQQAYARCLRELRRDIGCTPERLLDCPELLDTLRRRLALRSRATTIEACVTELKEVVAGLNDPRHRDPLMVALRFDERYGQDTLTARRTGYNDDLRRSPDPGIRRLHVDSLRTLERRENDGIETIARLLADESDGEPPAPWNEGDETPMRSGGSGDLCTEATAFVCYFSPTGSIIRNDVRVWVKAITTVTDQLIPVGYRYFSESRQGVLQISPAFGCTVAEFRESSAGGIAAGLRLHRTLEPADGMYTFAYNVVVHSDVPAEPVLRWKPLSGHMKRIEFHLVFDPAMSPVRAWWFHTTAGTEGQIAPSIAEERYLNIFDNGTYVYKIFEGQPLAALHYYGVAWDWRAQ